jgi:3-dehydroquinate synthase
MVAAAHVAAGRGGAAAWNGHAPSAVMTQLGLPARLPNALPLAGLMKAMQSDKKAVGGRLRLVLPFAMGDVRVVESVDSAAVEAAWRAVGAR